MSDRDFSGAEEKYQEQNEKYYLNLPKWPEFEIHDKIIDGLIPSCRIESWEDFDAVVKKYIEDESEVDFVFRGQKHYKWHLEPTLDRTVSGAVNADIAAKQLANFRLYTRGRLNDKAVLDNDKELWALGQHHGLATPLLDWSSSPYVALFFAFEGEDDPTWVDDKGEPTNYSRCVYVLNKTFIEDLSDINVPSQIGESLMIVEPSIDDHGRLVNQAGLFSIAPYGETLGSALSNHLAESGVNPDDVSEVAQYICRIHIPNDLIARALCLRKLRKMNIHHASLFPDLIGASGYCNDLIRDAVRSQAASESSYQREQTVELVASEPDVQDEQPEEQVAEETMPQAAMALPMRTPTQELKPRFPSTLKGQLLEALFVGDSVQKVSTEKLNEVVQNLIDFINSDSIGVDWHKKEPVQARLRIKTNRWLKRVLFPESLVDSAAHSIVQRACKLNQKIESSASQQT